MDAHGLTQVPAPGQFAPNTEMTFALYKPQSYTPLASKLHTYLLWRHILTGWGRLDVQWLLWRFTFGNGSPGLHFSLRHVSRCAPWWMGRFTKTVDDRRYFQLFSKVRRGWADLKAGDSFLYRGGAWGKMYGACSA